MIRLNRMVSLNLKSTTIYYNNMKATMSGLVMNYLNNLYEVISLNITANGVPKNILTRSKGRATS